MQWERVVAQQGEEERVEVVDVEFTLSSATPARLLGRPEDCYEAEGGDFELIRATISGKPTELTDDEYSDVCDYAESNYTKFIRQEEYMYFDLPDEAW